MKPSFDLHKLLRDVFQPQPGERVLVLTDRPPDGVALPADWADRQTMAREWRQAFIDLGLRAHPLFTTLATGANNADLPPTGVLSDGSEAGLEDLLRDSEIVVAMTEYSATAPLSGFMTSCAPLRVASMPGVLRRMEQSALAADYPAVARMTHHLADLLTRADSARVVFDTGHELHLDLRYRRGIADDGLCRPDKEFPLINLPSGEAFIVPYEGERAGEPSHTQGEIPVGEPGDRCIFQVEANRITDVRGSGPGAAGYRELFAADPARANVAELGLGCNEAAVVQGNVLEDEKAGFHWAYGRSEHLGGTVGPDAFAAPRNVLHVDIVYARGCPIGIRELTLTGGDADPALLIRDGAYQTAPGKGRT